jgi:hypothetical protein
MRYVSGGGRGYGTAHSEEFLDDHPVASKGYAFQEKSLGGRGERVGRKVPVSKLVGKVTNNQPPLFFTLAQQANLVAKENNKQFGASDVLYLAQLYPMYVELIATVGFPPKIVANEIAQAIVGGGGQAALQKLLEVAKEYKTAAPSRKAIKAENAAYAYVPIVKKEK